MPADVEAIIEDKCRACHGDPTANFAPMPLITQEDFLATHSGADAPNYARMAVRIQSERQPMPPITFPQLTAAERERLLQWADEGAPPGP